MFQCKFLYSGSKARLPSIIMTVRSRRLQWVGRVSRMGEVRNAYIILMENASGR